MNPRNLTIALLLIVLTAATAALAAPPAAPAALDLTLEEVVAPGQIERPVDIAFTGNAADERLFVVERSGRIRIARTDGSVAPTPFLDIRDRVEWESGSERGLLGLVFHPDYGRNGYFYVNYTAKPDGDTRVARFQVTADPDVADAGSEAIVLGVSQPYRNHNAGDLVFGPDGYLYVPLGDGGSGNDPGNRAQDTSELLGKVLRLDVDGGGRPADCDRDGLYTVPGDNPFVDGRGGACDEIWALGLRNPWRISFDRGTGDLFLGDVGQQNWEEVDLLPATSDGGDNFGWSCYEGAHANPDTSMPSCPPASAYTGPIFEYDHSLGCSVIGGYVYRGFVYPNMRGRYFLMDYCTGNLWDLARDGSGGWTSTLYSDITADPQIQAFGFTSFGEDDLGELYVANISSGTVYHLTEATRNPDLTPQILLPLVNAE